MNQISFNFSPPVRFNEKYLNHIQKKLESFSKVSLSQYGNIPLLVNLLSTSKKTLKIVDYGGGAGETFLKINKITNNI